MRTVGVEEELLLLDVTTGRPTALADRVLESAGFPPRMVYEFKLDQIEVQTPPCRDHDELLREITSGRRLADRAAGAVGARAAALGTSPLDSPTMLAPTPRFARIAADFGITADEQLSCALHVHVSVSSPEEGVAVLDRIREWLPLFIALSANSPFWQGRDTGFASFRTQVWNRWPTAGPQDVFGSVEAYRSHVEGVVRSGVALDEDMAYFDARLSRTQPTVEIRVADVPLAAADSALLAVLLRALVETAAREADDGAPPLGTSASHLRLAAWRASRSGLAGELVHPVRGAPAPAPEVVEALVVHLAPVLREAGELALVETGLAAMLESGTGERAQRAAATALGLRSAVELGSAFGRPDVPDRIPAASISEELTP